MIKPFKDILTVLEPQHVRKLPLILLAMLIGAGFEVVGLGLIIPVMEVMTNSSESKFVAIIYDLFPSISELSIVIIALSLFF